ncbi:MAG: 2Fe-2S iron-sulfur cluster-binding protein [Gammaproteobacteria bacterium]|nr:2Fe-2S iron-sulfur cluster-binding protein [Gammaproteobacteria bacterium]
MPHRVRIEPSGHEFEVVGGDTLLEGALRAGLAVDYGCNNGICGRCRARLISGEVHRIRHHDYAFGEAEALAGAILTCSTTPLGDVVIEAGEIESAGQLPHQEVTAQLQEVRPLGESLAAVSLRPPRSQRLRFLAGQRATLRVADLPPLELAIASCPCEEMRLEFHVPRLSDAPLTSALLDGGLRRFTPITVAGPHGDFVLDRNVDRPLVFVAIGTGFAPVRSLVEHALALEEAPRIHLERLTTPPHGAYLDNLCRSWADALDDFGYRVSVHPTEPGVYAHYLDELAGARIAPGATVYVAGPRSLAEPLATELEARLPSVSIRLETVGCPA